MGRGFLVLLGCVLAGCQFQADYGGTSYLCGEGQTCPAGQSCQGGVCRAPGTIDGGTRDAAPDALADAGTAAYQAAVLADEPVLYLRFEETGEPVAADSSGNDRDGDRRGGVSHEPAGAVGGAARFDGVDGRIAVAHDAALNLEGDFSIELWARLEEAVNTYPGLLRKGDAADGTGYLVYYRATLAHEPTFKRANLDTRMTDGAPLAADRFQHYVVTYTAAEATLRWYVDGELNAVHADLTFPPNTDASELTIGRGDEYGSHLIDELAIYDSALPAARIAAHHTAAGH